MFNKKHQNVSRECFLFNFFYLFYEMYVIFSLKSSACRKPICPELDQQEHHTGWHKAQPSTQYTKAARTTRIMSHLRSSVVASTITKHTPSF